ncbi:MAG: hypothetical protein CFE26_01690 [Verrucomicrobiales bacterium VVV1]|nr:MAG: hypothetical protein CFE26_01690 [Verrucomicrobiales bacterium VVV1]
MNQLLKLLIAITALLFAGCSHKEEKKYFSSYSEAKEFCDASVKAKNLSRLIQYSDLSGVPEPQLESFKKGLSNFETSISKKTLEKTLELSPEEHAQFLKNDFSKQTPGMQKLTGSWPDPKWNISPEKFIVYVFAFRQPGTESEFKLTFGLIHKNEGWVLACCY